MQEVPCYKVEELGTRWVSSGEKWNKNGELMDITGIASMVVLGDPGIMIPIVSQSKMTNYERKLCALCFSLKNTRIQLFFVK